MTTGKMLVANRGEIAVRICRAASEVGLQTVTICSSDDAASLHTRKADEVIQLPGRGVSAYLDGGAIIAAASEAGATLVHPGYGFLAENADFARQCEAAGIAFVGPTPATLALFGDKHAARALAKQHDVPVLPGTAAPTTLKQVHAFFESQGDGASVMIKAVAGGGGRGMRPVQEKADLDEAFDRCQSEALAGFGNGDLYVERMISQARHIEVQIIGDGRQVTHLWERDCSLQRRRQKLIEIAPAPNLDADLRQVLINASMRLATATDYRSLGTFEFLIDAANGSYYFIEANPRIQVEHTVTEEVTGVDLVQLQLQLAGGKSLSELGVVNNADFKPRGFAVQVRINTETMASDGEAKPGGGTITAFEPPTGRGVRVDSYGYAGYTTNPSFDSLLAKLIVHSSNSTDGLAETIAKAYRALCEFKIAGVPTNLSFLQTLLSLDAVRQGEFDTTFVESLFAADSGFTITDHPSLFFDHTPASNDSKRHATRAGASLDSADPLAVLAYGQENRSKDEVSNNSSSNDEVAAGLIGIRAPLQGTIVALAVASGDVVRRGAQLAVMEAMKMEHLVTADANGVVQNVQVEIGDTIWEHQLLMTLEPSDDMDDMQDAVEEVDLDFIRPDLAELLERRARTRDANRPEAVARRRKTNQRTARENVDDLVEPGSFVEYGPLVVAAQRQRRTLDDLMCRSPADGMITGVGKINGDLFGDPVSRAAVMAYDYTVFAGTQGVHNHWKTDRLLDVAERGRMPLVLFAEGGGGRPGESDYGGFVGQNTFQHFGKLSGLVPMVGVVSGRCFAGNAALLGCCDVIIATANANIGMGGPAMIEGGGLGVFTPEEVGSMADQVPNGVVDIPVEDEIEAVAIAKKYLGYFQGRITDWSVPDQRIMRTLVPENRLRVYEVRSVIKTLADEGSNLELRQAFGRTIITCFIRVEGRPVGVVANDPNHLGGAIDSDGADQGARFMQLCDAFDIPVLNLCDTPGIMVGPEAEKTGLVRHAARMFLTGNNLTVPFFTVVLRKAYGLGAVAMAGGNFRAPYYTVSWPTGEFGPMGLEGQVKLGYRAELAAIDDPEERREFYEKMVADSYEDGKALMRSQSFPIDDTIDPAETRFWLANLLSSIRPPAPRDGKKRPMIDAW
jgi:acetyl/propionyl-CoA carboxylase alpha subunit/acetyl-CoA carboxylase carboxyltransferase component